MYAKNNEVNYKCKLHWGKNSISKVRESNIYNVKDKNLTVKKDEDNQYLFAVNINIPDNVNMENIYVMDEWQKPRVWITGRGQCPEKAENDASDNFYKVQKCKHQFKNESKNELTGDASCLHCNLFIPEYYMHPDIRKSKYNALSYHKDDYLISGVFLKNHLHSVTTEMSFDINLQDEEKIDMISAGWLHHSNGNLDSNDKVEKILKYFYLDSSKIYESLILQYYDLLDTMKILIHTNSDTKKLQEVTNLAKSVLTHYEKRSMPNASFLESWIVMAEQTILTKNI